MIRNRNPLLNHSYHVLRFNNKEVYLNFTSAYETLIPIRDANQELKYNLFPYFEDVVVDTEFTLPEENIVKQNSLLITFRKLPLFAFSSVNLFKSLVCVVFGVDASACNIEIMNNEHEFIRTFKEIGDLNNYDTAFIVGYNPMVLTIDADYIAFRTPSHKQFFLTRNIESFYVKYIQLNQLKNSDYSRNWNNVFVQSSSLMFNPIIRTRINIIELYNSIKIDENCVYKVVLQYNDIYYTTSKGRQDVYIVKQSDAVDESNVKPEKKIRSNSLKLFFRDEIVNNLTLFLDGTFMANVTIKNFTPADKQHVADLIKRLNLREFETRLRENEQYITEEIDYEIKAEVDFEVTESAFTNLDNDYMYLNKVVGKRLFCNCSPMVTTSFLYNLFRKQYEMTYVNKLIFRNELNRKISCYDEKKDGQVIHYIEMKNFQSQQEYKLVISYLQFIMNNKALLIDNMFKDETEKIVNTDIKRLQIEDPELFGTYIVDGKPLTYSRLVSHLYERPVLISEDEFELLKTNKPNSVASLQNQTVKHAKTYLYCSNPEFSQINFRQLGSRCYPKCTKKLRSNNQFNACSKILDVEVNFEVLESTRTTEYNPELIPNMKCNLPSALKTIFPKSVCVCVSMDKHFRFKHDLINFKAGTAPAELLDDKCPDVITINQFCELYFKKKPVILYVYKNGFGLDESVLDKQNDEAMIVVKPDAKSDDGEEHYYILSTVNNLGRIIPITGISKLIQQIKIYNLAYTLLDKYYRVKPKKIEFVGYSGKIFGVLGDDGVFRSIPTFNSNVYKSITDLGSTLADLKLPELTDFYKINYVSTDGNSVVIDDNVFFIKHVTKVPYKRLYVDTDAEFELLLKDKTLIKKHYDIKIKEESKIRKLLSRAVTKGINETTAYEDLPFKTDDPEEVKIVFINGIIPSLIQSRLNRKDYEYYIQYTDSYQYIRESFSLHNNINEIVSVFEF